MEDEARKHFNKAEKALNPGLFRFKPDWQGAVLGYEKAAQLFKVSKNFKQARIAHEKAAAAHEKVGGAWGAGKQLEFAATCAQEAGDPISDTVELYKQAAMTYAESGKSKLAGDALYKAAKAVENADFEQSMKLYMEAIDAYELDDKDFMANDIFRSAVLGCVKKEKYDLAVPMLLRMAASNQKANAQQTVSRSYLSAIVCALAANDVKLAEQTLNDVLEVEEFRPTGEALAAELLVNKYIEGDGEEVKRIVAQESCFKYLDNAIARLAKKLPLKPITPAGRCVVPVDEDGNEDIT